MSLSTELTRMAQNVGALNADTNAIFEALRAKGVNVPANAQLSDVAEMIESIVIPHQNEVEIGGRWYPYVQIGNQLWLAENLDYKFQVNGSQIPIGVGGSLPSTPAAWYYNNDEVSYGIDGAYKCGLLYNGYATAYLENNKATLLPDGWQVPSKSDLDILLNYINSSSNGTKLKALDNSITQGFPENWNGTDDYGFNAIPSGHYWGSFRVIGSYGYYNTSTIDNNGIYRYYFINNSGSVTIDHDAVDIARAIRLVRTIS